MTKAKRRIIAWAITLATVGIAVDRLTGGWNAVFYAAHLLYLEHVPPLTWPRDTFSPEAWKQTPPGGRYRFVKSLLSSDQLTGRTPSEVDQLLGGMRADRLGCLDMVGPDDHCTYLVRKVGSEGLWWILVVEFKDGRVSEARRTLAFID